MYGIPSINFYTYTDQIMQIKKSRNIIKKSSKQANK